MLDNEEELNLKERNLVEVLRSLSEDERRKIMRNFCRVCYTEIDHTDWSGSNYCHMCSPDPRD